MTAARQTPVLGMRMFFMVWIGQVVSLIGSSLTGFALIVWTYQQTNSVMQTSLTILAQQIPSILLAPFAGVLVDRWDRRWIMILSDSLAGLTTLAVAALMALGRFEIWHIYLISGIYAVSRIFQEPAYTAATTLLVPPEHYGRISGMMQLANAIASIAAPAIAGGLLLLIGFQGILAIDVVTFVFALVTLLIARFPPVEIDPEAAAEPSSVWRDLREGWGYLLTTSGMLGLLLLFMAVNFAAGFVNVLLVPLLLSFTSSAVLGTIASVAGIGALLGSIAMSVWGGPKRKVYGVIGAVALLGLMLMLMGLRPEPLLAGLGAFGVLFTVPIMQGCNQAILQSTVPPQIQGRVFATQRMLAMIAMPIPTLLAGPLVDQVFNPLLAAGGPLADTVGQIMGTGPGRGIGLLYVVMGGLVLLAALAGLLAPRLRHVEAAPPADPAALAPAETSSTPAV